MEKGLNEQLEEILSKLSPEPTKEQIEVWDKKYGKHALTEEQVENLKKKHGAENIIKASICNQDIYLLRPEASENYFHTFKRAYKHHKEGNDIDVGEVLFNDCYLGGLGVKSNDAKKNELDRNTPLFTSLCIALSNILEVNLVNFTTA